MEQWRDVEGFEGQYQVSSEGRVRRLEALRNCGGGRTATMPERTWPGYVDTQGYYSVNLGRQKKTTVHRIVCVAFHGPAPEGKRLVAHWDGNKLNNRADNLRWVSHLENSQDGRRMHENCINEKAWKARLNKDDVRAIRQEYEAMGGRRGAINQIAVRRGLQRWHVNQIIRRKLWANIQP